MRRSSVSPNPTPDEHADRSRVVAVALAALCVGALSEATERALLTTGELTVLGVQLTVDPPHQTVPVEVPFELQTRLVSAADPSIPLGPGLFPDDVVVRGELSGPGVSAALTTRPGEPFALPALPFEGAYVVDDIRLVSGDRVLLRASPARATIEARQLLVTAVTSRVLDLDEIRDLGVVIDASSYEVRNIRVELALESEVVAIDLPHLVAPDGAWIPLPKPRERRGFGSPGPPVGRSKTFEIGGFTPVEPEADGVPPVEVFGVISFDQSVGFLHQFYAAALVVMNQAPAGSGIALTDATAAISFPPDDEGLRLARTVPAQVAQSLPVRDPGPDGEPGTADDVVVIAAAQGTAEATVEGLQEGDHTVRFDLSGTLTGLEGGDLAVGGRVEGVVTVRNPTFDVTFVHPHAVELDEVYDLGVVVMNNSDVAANLVTLRLPAGSIGGARLVDPDPVRVIDTIPPGEAASVSFTMQALRRGQVVASRIVGSDDTLSGRLELTLNVADLGVPVAAPTLQLDNAVRHLPEALVGPAAYQLAGE